jgi:hypothetical protein
MATGNITSQQAQSRQKVVNIYQTRMQIEEGFRDMKSHRYGLGFDTNLSKQKNRISIFPIRARTAMSVQLVKRIS